MNLLDILKLKGFDLNACTKMMRHQSKNFDTEEIFERGYINEYQSVQSKDLLNCDYLISFIARGQTKACFAGVWKVKGQVLFEKLGIPDDFPYPRFFTEPGDIFYDLEKVERFDDLNGRLIIDWGKGTRSWHQWLKDKPVLEILPKGHIKPFPGYLDFVLSYDELYKMVGAPDPNRTWHQMLKSVAGIYLITDKRRGQQYVGSANGKDGILGRWRNYASNGHGGNTELRTLLGIDPNYAQHFAFTILRTLPASITAKEVIAFEQLYKLKLGSRAHGLNLN